MKFGKLAICLLVVLISAKADADQALPLGRWIKDAENILRGQTSAAVLSMRIKKETYQRDYDLMSLTDDRSASSKVMIKMLGPALWRGNVTLKVADKITFYDPRSNRVTVMGSSMLGDNWMGSHFTNDDLMRETDLSKHYTYELVEQEPSRDEVGAAVTRYHIRLTPKPIAPVAWGKVIYRLYLDQNRRVFPEQLDYYARAADVTPSRTLVYSTVKSLDGKRVPTRLVMTPDKHGEFTEIEYKKIKFDVTIQADEFAERALR